MTKQEWLVWDRVFCAALWETGPGYGPRALAAAKKSMSTTVLYDQDKEETILSVEDRIKFAGSMADIAITERRRR